MLYVTTLFLTETTPYVSDQAYQVNLRTYEKQVMPKLIFFYLQQNDQGEHCMLFTLSKAFNTDKLNSWLNYWAQKLVIGGMKSRCHQQRAPRGSSATSTV